MNWSYGLVNAHPIDPANGPGSHLFDAVWVDCGLWLQYADWFRFLGALGHLTDFLRDEVVDTIKGFDCTLYQTDAFCRSCVGEDKHSRTVTLSGYLASRFLTDLIETPQKSAFILKCFGNETCSLTYHKRHPITKLLLASPIYPINRESAERLKRT